MALFHVNEVDHLDVVPILLQEISRVLRISPFGSRITKLVLAFMMFGLA